MKKARKVQQDQSVHRVFPAKLAPKAQQAQRDRLALKVLKDHRELLETLALRALLVHRARLDRPVPRDWKVLRVLQEGQDQ